MVLHLLGMVRLELTLGAIDQIEDTMERTKAMRYGLVQSI